MTQSHIEIINGDNDPPLPFMVLDRFGMHIDLEKIGQLWDGPTVARVVWGIRDPSGQIFGRVFLKNGTSRTFFDPELIRPYVNAFNAAKASADATALASTT